MPGQQPNETIYFKAEFLTAESKGIYFTARNNTQMTLMLRNADNHRFFHRKDAKAQRKIHWF
jgi:hypothetical protein